MALMDRRDFIKCSVIGSLSLLPCGLLSAPTAEAFPISNSSTYYVTHKEKLKAEFADVLDGVSRLLVSEYGSERTQEITQRAMVCFNSLLPNFPDVGGEENWDSKFIPIAGWYVALYPPMKANGKTAEDLGKLIYELNKTELEEIPTQKALDEGGNMFTKESLDKMKKWAEWTQKREYPANWVAYFVPGDGKDFDYGYDYSECGAVKYFHAQGVPELAPYFCLNDFPNSAVYGTGLRRKGTIAQGDEVCDFRYMKGRPVIQDWTTEIDLIRSRVSRRL